MVPAAASRLNQPLELMSDIGSREGGRDVSCREGEGLKEEYGTVRLLRVTGWPWLCTAHKYCKFIEIELFIFLFSSINKVDRSSTNAHKTIKASTVASEMKNVAL